MGIYDEEVVNVFRSEGNRDEFLKNIEHLLKDYYNASVMMVGVNNFSSMNYIHGYEFSDEVIERFACLVKEVLPANASIYRLYGVKFALCLPEMNKIEVESLYHEIQEIARKEIVIDNEMIAIRVSAGAVALDYFNKDVQAICSCTEYALEQSKQVNHGELVFLEGIMMEGHQKQLEIYEVIHHAIIDECKGFYMCYQSVIDAKTGKITGAESLLRWKNDTLGEVQPGRFIKWLENDPAFYELGNWILRKSLTDGVRMLEIQPDFMLSVNIAYSQLERNTFRASLEAILKETGFPAKNLCLELKERNQDLNFELLKREVEYFHSLGISISIDDFGTGYASLDLICEVPVETVKIDQSFVLKILHRPVNQLAVEMLSEFAHKLDINVCLEGIENQEICDFVKRYDVKYYQGFLYAKPEDIRAFLKRLLTENE